MANILMVVHRGYPHPGGSEYYVHNMAKEMVARNHFVVTLCHQFVHDEVDGVKFTSDYNLLTKDWDLIVVHGADCISQNIVLQNLDSIKSPVLYMIIKPSISPFAINGITKANFVAWSTPHDLKHINSYHYQGKVVNVRHGIPHVPKSTGIFHEELKRQGYDYDEDTQFLMSAGGFWPHKGFEALTENAELDWYLKNTNKKLCLFGYHGGYTTTNSNVFVFENASQELVHDAMHESECYIMNSIEEGFGLVLLEASSIGLPWISSNVGGARMLCERAKVGTSRICLDGTTELISDIFGNHTHLTASLRGNSPKLSPVYDLIIDNISDTVKLRDYVLANHMITNTVDDIEKCL